jgi:hypothetical protein
MYYSSEQESQESACTKRVRLSEECGQGQKKNLGLVKNPRKSERERERMLPGLIVGCLGQLQRSEAVGLVVIDEEDNQTLLVHRISADDIYRRQEGGCIPLWAGRKNGFCFLSDVAEAKENYPS